ncbi:MAG: SNF2-related protein [Planctomycetota bacterium]|jgi:hypothetical protein
MVQQVGKDTFKLDSTERELYTSSLAGVCGVKLIESHGEIVDILIHRNHLPLVPDAIRRVYRLENAIPDTPHGLRDYQFDAIRFARTLGLSGCGFFHDLGLGKNYMVLAAMDYPALALCPTSALQVWESEAQGYNREVQIHQGHDVNPREISHEADIHLVTYGSAPYWLPWFHGRGGAPRIRTVVPDEAHALHKYGSRVSRALKRVRRDQTIVMTATPARNRLKSLHGLLDAISPTGFGSLAEFRVRYCGATTDAYGRLTDGPELTHVDELVARLSEICIAETWLSPRVQHLRPPLERQHIQADLTHDQRLQMINDAIQRAYSKVKTAGSSSGTQMGYLTAQRVELGKLKAQWFVENIMEDLLSRHDRVIIWCWHKAVVRYLLAFLLAIPVHVVVGEVPTAQRRRIVNEWQHSDPHKKGVLVATLGSMSTAVNLTSAEAAVFLEHSWAPIDLQQAEARHHRPGSKHKKVYSYYISGGMIDNHMATTLLEKVEDIEAALGVCSQKTQMLTLLERSC